MTNGIGQPGEAGKGQHRNVVGKIVGYFSAGGFVIAFFLEWGYWRGFGISFEEIPVSVQFLLEAALVWLPGLLLFALALVIHEIFALRPDVFENPSMQSKFYSVWDDMPPFRFPHWKEMWRPTIWCPWIAVISVPFLYFMEGVVPLFAVIIFVLFGWRFVMRILLNYTPMKIFKGMLFTNLIFAMPALAALLFLCGYWAALRDSDNLSKLATIHFQQGASYQKKELIVLRNADKFIIAFDYRARKISVISGDSVQELLFHFDSGQVIMHESPKQ